MRSLLVSYAEIGVNSTEHVVAFARGLAALGWDVHVAVLVLGSSSIGFRFYSCSADGSLTPLESAAELDPFDVVHVWTPRGAIWDFIERYSRLLGRALILHLEDDEEEILNTFAGPRVQKGIALRADSLHVLKLEHLSHPLLARCLAGCADGVTVLSPELSGTVGSATPCLPITPPLDAVWLARGSKNRIPRSEQTVVFSGSVHAAFAGDFLTLCQAVGMLVEKGRPIRLVRCGPPAVPPKLVRQGARLARNFDDVGFLPREELKSLLANATVLVQPGRPSVFNRRRFPAKLAPYLASGTPVVMPACYDWTGIKHDEHAIMFKHGEAADIARAIETVLDAPELSREMGERAAAFARSKFGSAECCRLLDGFYRRVLERPLGVSWRSLRQPRVELPLWLAAHPTRAGSELRTALTRFAVEEAQRVSVPRSQTGLASFPHAPLVSVVVPSFNHRRFLPERFASIFAQTYRNLELVILDDASTDGSLDCIRSLESPFPLRILLNATNSGSVFQQWQRGVAESRGEFVWIAESDDSCRPDLIEKLLAVASRNAEIGLTYAQSLIVDEDGHEIESFLDYTDEIDRDRWRQDYVNAGGDEAARYLVIRNTIPNASACLFRRAALLEARLDSITLRVCGDWLTYARICERHAIAFVAEHLNFYRRHSSTAREQASRDGFIFSEMYSVQSYILDRFEVSPAMREAAGRATFRDLLHALKRGLGNRGLVDDAGLLGAVRRFDPRLRERMAGKISEVAPTLELRGGAGERTELIYRGSYDAFQWTQVRVGRCPGSALIVPITRAGVVALRRIQVRDVANGAVLWSAETGEDYRRIELGGDAHRIGSREALEIFAWGAEPQIHLPLEKLVRSGVGYELAFEIRHAALPAYECPFESRAAGKTKRALFIVPHLELGGADRFNLDLIAQLTRRFDWEITVVTTKRAEDVWREKFEELTPDVFMLHRFLPFAAYPAFLTYVIESRQPDVVYLSQSELGYRLLPWLKATFPELPVVDLVHLVMEDWKDGGFPRFSSHARPWLARTVAISADLKRWLVAHGAGDDQVDVVYCNTDVQHWTRSAERTADARARWKIPGDRPVILYAARFCAQKNPEALPEIVRRLETQKSDFLLVLAGDGPQRLWVEEHVGRAFPRSTQFIGPVEPDAMRLLMSAADLLVLPSHAEGIALVLYEALSMGVVPVATDVGGQRELITPECGVLVPADARVAETSALALASLLADPDRRKKMAAAGRRRVENDFNLDLMGDRMDAIFKSMILETGRPLQACNAVPADLICRVASDLVELENGDFATDAWGREIREGKWILKLVSESAAWLRRSPARHWFRRFEIRHGERLGRWLMR